MKQIILGIHGLGNKPSEKLLKKWWIKSIREGLNRLGKDRLLLPFDIVYWADILYSQPLDPKLKNKNNTLYIDEPYIEGVIKERKQKSSFKIKLLKYIESQLDNIFLNDDLSINFKNVTDKIIHKYFSDLETYYTENRTSITNPETSAKVAIQNRLFRKLKKYKDYQILLIGHSMGSIVAYDVLSALPKESKIHTFITIGSPLGLPVIVARTFAWQKLQNPKIKKPKVPECIDKKWINISDIEDKVALDHTLADDYSSNVKDLKAEDIYVYNDYENNGESNPHKSFGYLRNIETAKIINEFLLLKNRDKMFQKYKKFTNQLYSKIVGSK